MMTARENILMAYHHEEPYWVPSQYLDQNTCLYTATQEGVKGFGRFVDCFGISWDYRPGDEGPMVTKGTRRLEDIEDWRETLPMPDCESWPWEERAARDTAVSYTHLDVYKRQDLHCQIPYPKSSCSDSG